ncbi:HNH endonuclease [Streptomyces bauhiniae]|uniref:HNH endonuclease n=1 Tax=Streptomyces bauhiniae TaxID=2340725 RepID=UPI0037D382AF
MPEGRPPIPRELRRAVLVEAGHRCAIPTCRQHPVDVEHIDDWAKVKEHRFENLIALCPTCHRRKGDGSDQIDRKSLRQYKANLAVVNDRYGDLERRILEAYAEDPDRGRSFVLHASSLLLVRYLERDGLIEQVATMTPSAVMDARVLGSFPGFEMYHMFMVTEAGAEMAARLRQGLPLP